ncbi:DUF6777 domain-containing protein [Streptomyces sp. NEAU-Y11]|uniref:DUF6777 domain-containing protein n=1 Tax=Streptomyces cucumeris TaxID=2962890 RepID=UPI0020C92D83|nr:DUF6777 domain-containing protein [Streptomyces sp. NEAU-Y11]MCP9210003.1 serine/arginine repetitive matrix protein 1 [Streptomyces sp. NEAU-Y11]
MRSSTWHLTSRRSALFIGLVAVVAAVVVVGMVSPSGKASGRAAAAEFRREPIGKTSVPAFTRAVGQDRTDLESPSNGGRAFLGNTPGLYAGAPDRQSCDRGELIRGLQADPKKAATWSRLQHLGSADAIPDYVGRLTGAVLRSDTYAKVYGSRAGAKPSSAVLQAGTAVFVNQRGVPVVKCNCGSPVRMAAPPQDARPTFTGPEWTGFSKSTVTEIQAAPNAVKRVVMLEAGGKSDLFKRPLGDGGKGGDDSRSADTVLAKADYPPYLAMPGEQGAPDLPEAPKPGENPSEVVPPLETKRPSGSPSGGMPEAQTSDQPTDPNQQPTDPAQQTQPSDPNQQPSDPAQQSQPPSQPQPDPNQTQQQPPPNQPPPNQPPPNQPPPNQPPPDQNQQPQPDPNQTQPPPQPPPSGP